MCVFRRLIATVMLVTLMLPSQSFAQVGQLGKQAVVRFVTEVVVGIGAAKAAQNWAEAKTVYQQEDLVLKELQKQGNIAPDAAIFSLYYKLNWSDCFYWQRWFGKPDVFAVVSVGGVDTYLVPQIDYKYDGHPVLITLLGRTARPGSKVVINLYDDRSTANTIWNTILQTTINYKLGGQIGAGLNYKAGMQGDVKAMAKVECEANGNIRLLDHPVVIVSPDHMASAEFVVPSTTNGIWSARAIPYKAGDKACGVLEFAQVWTAPQHQNQIADQINRVVNAKGQMWFWGIVGIVLVVVLIQIVRLGKQNPKVPPT